MGTFEHLRYEPFSFGVCEEQDFFARVKSSAWKEEEQRVRILGRREGEELKIYIPKILGACKTGIEVDCAVTVDLSEYADLYFDLKYTFTTSMMFYDADLQTFTAIPAGAKLGIEEGKTFLSFLPSKGVIFNENRFTANKEILFGIMDTTVTLNFNLFDMCIDVKEEEDDDDDEMSGEESDDEHKYEGDYIGFVPASESDLNNIALSYDLPASWKYKKMRCLAYCKAWTEEKRPATLIVGVDNLETPTKGSILFMFGLTEFIAYSNTCEGSEIIVKENGVLADFFKNIPDGILNRDTVYNYHPKNYDCFSNFVDDDEAIIYYYDNSFRITPNTDTYKYFYPLTNRLISRQVIGYPSFKKLLFNISHKEEDFVSPENRTNLRANVPKLLDPSTITEDFNTSKSLAFKVTSDLFSDDETKYYVCSRTATTGNISISELYAPMIRTDGFKKDVVKIELYRDFDNLYGGYLPSGKLGNCKILYYNMFTNRTEEIDGLVYFYAGKLNIIPRDKRYPYFKYWYSKDNSASGEDPVIGIKSLEFEFEIQKSEPIYVDLSVIEEEELDEYGIPYSWVRETIQVNVTCNTWKDSAQTANIFIAKNAEKPTEGVIVIPPLMHEIAYQGSFHGYEILIDDNDQMMNFFGLVPDHFISEDGVAYNYCPMRYDTCYNYKTEKAFLYYNEGFYIGIKNDIYNCFYPLVNNLIKPRKIGIKDKWVIRFKVPETAEYGDANDGGKEISNELLTTDDKFNNTERIDGSIKVTMDSKVISAPIEGEVAFSFIEGEVTLNIQKFYQDIKAGDNYKSDILYLHFDDSFGDIFGGYFPAGLLPGTCTLRIYDKYLKQYRNSMPGLVYYYQDALNIIRNSEEKSLDSIIDLIGYGNDFIGIQSLELKFKIQKEKPTYINYFY